MTAPDVQQALDEAVAVIYLGDSSDYLSALWEVVLALGGTEAVELLANDSQKAYERYCNAKQK